MKNQSISRKLNTTKRSPLYVAFLSTSISNPKTSFQRIRSSRDQAFLQTIKNVIYEKIGDSDLGIEHLCEAVYLSHSQVFRKVKALTGKHPTGFIQQLRLQKAKELLQCTDLNISEIAYDLGFTDPNYFSRVFRKALGKTPSSMRNL